MLFNYHGKIYFSVKECCETLGLKHTTVASYKTNHGLNSYVEAIDACVENKKNGYGKYGHSNIKEDTRWQRWEIETIKEMAKEGKTRKEISEAIGRTYSATNKKLNSLGIKTAGWSQKKKRLDVKDIDTMISMVDAGFTIKHIATIINKDTEIVRCKLHELGYAV